MRARRVRKHETTAASGRPAKHSQVSHLLPSRSGPARAHASQLLRRLLHLHAASGSPLRYPLHHGPRTRAIGTPGLTHGRWARANPATFRLEPAEEAAVRKMVNFLRAASSLHRAETPLMEQSMRDGTPYSFTEHQRERGELFAKVTEPIGWNVRELFQDNHLAPYDVWRQLRFLEFKIRLRDLIMNRLNTTLSEVGSQLD